MIDPVTTFQLAFGLVPDSALITMEMIHSLNGLQQIPEILLVVWLLISVLLLLEVIGLIVWTLSVLM